jgi:hypothetical protein
MREIARACGRRREGERQPGDDSRGEPRGAQAPGARRASEGA